MHSAYEKGGCTGPHLDGIRLSQFSLFIGCKNTQPAPVCRFPRRGQSWKLEGSGTVSKSAGSAPDAQPSTDIFSGPTPSFSTWRKT